MQYDIAAYIWPAYTGRESRSSVFWPQGMGEWQTVLGAAQNAPLKPAEYVWNRKPLWGPVDEADPRVMEMQIDAAVSHGVNVFIYDWYWYDRRPFLEQCLNEGFLGAANNQRMKFYLMWANHDANYTWDTRLSDSIWRENCPVWLGQVDRAGFETVARRVIERYFSRPNYYRIGGRPVFMIYDVDNLIAGLGGVEQTREALDWFRAETVRAGHPGLELQLTGWGERVSNLSGVDGQRKLFTKEILPLLGFDSLTNYQFVHFCDMNRDYRAILRDVQEEWKRVTRDYTVPFYPHVSVGWDNNPRFRGYVPQVCRGNDPAAFEEALRMAKEYVDKVFPKQSECEKIQARIRKELKKRKLHRLPAHTALCGVGGTARALLMLAQEQQELPDTQRLLTVSQLKKLEKALWKKDGKAREMLLKTCPDRLHTIYPGMLILDELVQLSQCETIYISKYGVREGYLRRELARKKKTIEPEK